MIKNLIFLGAPGSGKGSTADELCLKFDMKHISTGDIFRKEIALKSELGIKISQLVEKGLYVPDDLTNKIIEKEINSLKKEHKFFILDGYPRTKNQAEFLSTILNDEEVRVVFLEIPIKVLLERLSFRRNCPVCKKIYHLKFKPSKNKEYCENHLDNLTKLVIRNDDKEAAIYERLKIFNEITRPIINYYKEKNNLIIIDKVDTIEAIAKLISEKVFND